MNPHQYRPVEARRPLRCTLLSIAVLLLLGLARTPSSTAAPCPAQHLRAVTPEQMGVLAIALAGELSNTTQGDNKEYLVLRGFVRVSRTFRDTTRLFGYAWLDNLTPGWGWGPLTNSKYAKGPPLRIRLYYMHPEDYTWVGSVDVKTTWGEKDPDHGFRLDAEIPSHRACTFNLTVNDWVRGALFGLHAFRVAPNVLAPWYNMDAHKHANHIPYGVDGPGQEEGRHGNHGAQVQSGSLQSIGRPRLPPKDSPLVMVMQPPVLGHDHEQALFQIQTLLRHIEYHLLQAKMQRYILYMRAPTYYNRMLRTYLARHLPPEAAPYVTLVLWQGWEYVSKYWDQHQIYYHAVTAYSGYANVMCTFLDTDEYISWRKPAATIHQALAQCGTDHLESIGFVPMYALAEKVVPLYKDRPQADRDMWVAEESVTAMRGRQAVKHSEPQDKNVPVGDCRWYTNDPLKQYTLTSDDSVLQWVGRTKYINRIGQPVELTWANNRTTSSWAHFGKTMTRIATTGAFTHHRAAPLPPHKMEYLDPECMFVTHIYNLYGSRVNWWAPFNEPQFYQKRWRNKWWLIPDA